MRTVFKDLSDRTQLFLFFFLWILFFITFGVLTALFMQEVFDLSPLHEASSQADINKYKLLQMISSIGIFVLPPVLLMGFFKEKKWEFLKVKGSVSVHTMVLTFLIWFFAVPLLNLSIQWNESLQLPESLSFIEDTMRELEDNAKVLTNLFLQSGGFADLLVNMLIVAVIPAVGEELLFRGVIQQYLQKITGRIHIAIWLSALLFSLLHFQFFGFLPRMLLGGLFGYLFYWSGSLWVPIFAHFLNNGIAVVVSYYSKGNNFQEKVDHLGTADDFWYFTIPSALLLVWMIRFFRKEQGVG